MKDACNANEADVRAEIADPLIAMLGYERGTVNDVRRELTLTYEHVFLGRKKKTDPPLRGRADYVLVVTGAGRWALDAKAPNEEITQDAVEQVITYARHPEVGGSYAVVLNGRTLVVYRASGTFADGPLVTLPFESPMQLAEKLAGLLSPAAIRRDCSPPVVDLGKPLAEGFRSSAIITTGVVHYHEFVWGSNFQLPAPPAAILGELARRMTGFKSIITGGKVWRDEATSRIKAKLAWNPPHDELLRFAQDKKLLDVEHVSLDPVVSADPDRPTVFDVVGSVRIKEGELLFDQFRWNTRVAEIESEMTYRGQAVGIIKGARFTGTFLAEYESTFASEPGLRIMMTGVGTFEIHLDGR
jgi:hypothetical protein